jgi:hypothetical protein
MSDQVALDLFIQDFVKTNKLLNQHYTWDTLISRRYMEGGTPRIFEFTSGETTYYAVGRHIMLPDMDCFRIEFTRTIPDITDHRFDYLQMLSASTHTGVNVNKVDNAITVTLTTRHRGFMNIIIVIREGLQPSNPLVAV